MKNRDMLSMIISILFAILYILTFGMFTFRVKLPNREEIYYKGWLV